MRRMVVWNRALVALVICCGCGQVAAHRDAREVSREQLVRIADAGAGDGLRYLGTQAGHHYFETSQGGVAGTYRIRESALPFIDTFRLGDEAPYTMYPHVIEGRALGKAPTEIPDAGAAHEE